MQTTKNRHLSRTILALSVMLAGAAWADYAIIDLGRIDGATPSGIIPTAINNDGVIVGSMYTSMGLIHGASYDGTQITDISPIAGAIDISNSGYIVGNDDSGRALVNFLPTYLGSLGGATPTTALARSINDSGEVVGSSTLSNDPYPLWHAFLYSGGTMTDIGTLGGPVSTAYSINNYGAVVGGSSITGNSAAHPFLYSGGAMLDLGTLGGTFGLATSINDNGQIVGYSFLTGDATNHAFIYDGGAMIDIGTLTGGNMSEARSINNNGDIVGDSNIAPGSGYEHPFLYSNGTMQDLNALLPLNSGWILLNARDINDYGQIVGEGTLNGVRHGYMLSPGC